MHRWLGRIAQAFALLGVGLLIAVAAAIVLSVVGRNLFGRPLFGDVELTQMGVAIGLALCLPWCQLRRAHIAVDFFTQHLPPTAVWLLEAVGALLMTVLGLLLAWRTAAGAWSVYAAGETTMILGLPMWWAYAGLVPGLLLSAAVAFWQAVLLMAGRVASA